MALTAETRQHTIDALHRTWAAGGYPDTPGGPVTPATTLSVVKALDLLGTRPRDPDTIRTAVLAESHPLGPAWLAPGTQSSAVLATAAGLLCLSGIGATADLERHLLPGLAWMADHATSREEHFMTIAVADECGVASPSSAVEFLRSLERPDGTFGPSPLQNGIAASALIRAGQALRAPQAVVDALLSAQTQAGGFSDAGAEPQLWTSYCCMRALDLLHAVPDRERLTSWVLGLLVPGGGFGEAGEYSAHATYQCLSILDWLISPIISASGRGDIATVERHLRDGGDPDRADLRGWTPLAAAAVRGQAAVVRLLLTGVPAEQPSSGSSGSSAVGRAANPDIRVPDADALPIFWAGQSGDLETVQAILEVRPDHLFETCSVNGHTVLLQACFFGSKRHVDIVRSLVEGVGSQTGGAAHTPVSAAEHRSRLLAACNVRGFTALGMARLWNNEPLIEILTGADDTTPEQRQRYHATLMDSIAALDLADTTAEPAARLTDNLLDLIVGRFEDINALAERSEDDLSAAESSLFSTVTALIANPEFDIDLRGGPLGQTPIIAAVTGTNATPRVEAIRARLVSLLLDHGADPDLPERHPMAVDAVIRAAVLNHFTCLREIARRMPPLAFAAALNERPAINGQTALADTVHRALTSSDETVTSHLDQIRWIVEHGGRTDIPDFTGVTVLDRALLARADPVMADRANAVLEALGWNDG